MAKAKLFGMGCCCPTIPTVDGCTCCEGAEQKAAEEYSFTIAGFSGPWAALNGTYVVTYYGKNPIFNFCFWRYTFPEPIIIETSEFESREIGHLDFGLIALGLVTCTFTLNFMQPDNVAAVLAAGAKLCPCSEGVNPDWENEEECDPFSTENCGTHPCLQPLRNCCPVQFNYDFETINEIEEIEFTPVEP